MRGHRGDPNVYFRVSNKDEVVAWGQTGELQPSARSDSSPLPENRIYFWRTHSAAKAYARHLYRERKLATGYTLYDDLVIVGIRVDPKVVETDPAIVGPVAEIGESHFTVASIPWSNVLSTEVLL